jgi:hypothetical protein
MLHESLLDRVEPAVLGKPFDGQHLFSLDSFYWREAGPGCLSVDQNRAGTAVPLAAAILGSG